MPLYANDHIYCVDIGSIKGRNFGWAGVSIDSRGNQFSRDECEDIWKLVDEIAERLNNGAKVYLGFECPLWVPVRDDPKELTRLGLVMGIDRGRLRQGRCLWQSD